MDIAESQQLQNRRSNRSTAGRVPDRLGVWIEDQRQHVRNSPVAVPLDLVENHDDPGVNDHDGREEERSVMSGVEGTVQDTLPVRRAQSIKSVTSRASTSVSEKRRRDIAAAEEIAQEELKMCRIRQQLVRQKLAIEEKYPEEDPDDIQFAQINEASDIYSVKTTSTASRKRNVSTPAKEELTGDGAAKLTEAITKAIAKINIDNRQPYLRKESMALPKFRGDVLEWSAFEAQLQSSTQRFKLTNEDNIARLRNSLEGSAKEAVKALLVSSANVPKIVEILQLNFGRPRMIIKKLIEQARKVERLTEWSEIVKFSNVVCNLVETIKSLRCKQHLENPQLLDELAEKLPFQFRFEWMAIVEQNEEVNLGDFNKFVIRLARTASLMQDHTFVSKKSERVFPAREEKDKSCQFCEEFGHWVNKCEHLSKLSLPERLESLKKKKLCFCCLQAGHRSRHCQKRRKCGKEGCPFYHHILLHDDTKVEQHGKNKEQGHVIEDYTPAQLAYVPVVLSANGREIRTFAFLDEGCTPNLVDSRVMKQLNLEGKLDPLSLALCRHTSTEDNQSKRVDFSIRGDFKDARVFKIFGARTIDELGVSSQTLEFESLKKKFKYLEGLPIQSYENETPLIIIGQASRILSLSRRCVHRGQNRPVAYKTWLGWVCSGKLPNQSIGREEAHFSTEKKITNDALHQLVKESFTTESFGVQVIHEKIRCNEDKRALQLLNENTRRIDSGGYESALLWKEDFPKLPSSYKNAFSRLQSQERKMDKDLRFAELYAAKIDEYLRKGYAKSLTPEEAFRQEDKIYYLPHFGVYNPNKPGKMRFVFDAAFKNNGVSLNDCLLQGPDFLNSLPSVLMRFRRKKIAFSADITDMFHRIKIRKEDNLAQRFLFRGMDRVRKPDVYEMKVMLFGATCSPSTALFVKNLNAEHHRKDFPKAYEAIVNQFYMDDYLDSTDTKEEAIDLIREVNHVNKCGNFTLCKWVSSSKEVIEQIPPELQAEGLRKVDLQQTEIPTRRVLGIWWNPEKDTFTFKNEFHKVLPDIIEGKKTPTKREFLQLLMSVFDPLGFVAHVVVRGKILLQSIWKVGIDWNEEIPQDLIGKWKKWLIHLQNITRVEIERCYSPLLSKAENIQLHVFVDASQQAFSCCAFLRIQSEELVDVTLVAAKTRVAPLKMLSIPRLELQAAVMGSRMGKSIHENIGVTISDTFYWTDSQTVLCWIKARDKRFKQFVSHRLGEIAELTDMNNWRWVPTEENVADDATRDEKSCDLSSTSRWFHGPSFLKDDSSCWPLLPVCYNKTETSDEEEAKEEFFGRILELEKRSTLIAIENFSSYSRLIGVVGWIKRFQSNLRKKRFEQVKNNFISVKERRAAEKWVVKWAQMKEFSEDLKFLEQKRSVSASSRLTKLSPFLDEDNIIRMRSRLDYAKLANFDQKYPIILDGKSHLAKLLILHYHHEFGHVGRGLVSNELRRRFWIIGLGNAVRRTINQCGKCRRRKIQPVAPEMGDVPDAKLAAFHRPFTYCGVDCFGPMEVTVKRSKEKRYGMIFTCLTTRAIHLELLSSLSTDSCLQALLRMRARRGTPKHIFSDNGTNFVGSKKELVEAAIKKDIEWHFNPPAAPHMGGSWERLIRSVKNAMMVILREQAPKEELLRTVLLEAEYIVNNRPLTQVPVDYDTPVALTPNDFLIAPDLTSNSSKQTSELYWQTVNGKDLRKMWMTSQWYADQFWKRWRTEYLQTLTKREKWNKTTLPINLNDVVLVVDHNVERNNWPLGLVTATYPGKDGIVRVVDVKIVKEGGKQNFKTFRRPVTKLCLLEKNDKI